MSRTIEPDDRTLSMAAADPYLRLAVGVVRTAVLDAQAGELEAARWLASEDALPFLGAAGIGPDRVIDWINEHFRIEVLQ